MSETTPTGEHLPIFQRSVKGRFRNLKYIILGFGYLIYFLLPWMPWERAIGPNQAVLFDIMGRKYYLFGLVVHPQQIFWLAGFLIIAAILLFFITGVAGRVFCGYFCFQTLWTDVFMRIEHMIQGERPARIRLAKQAWNKEKIGKMVATHVSWFLVALATAITFALYWGEAGVMLKNFFTGTAASAMYITVLIVTATTYTMAGLAREQVCTHMCPYSRFQSAMFDKDTLIVAYDEDRGEGENGRSTVTKVLKKRDQRAEAGVGDCIDCGYCVQVCPTGIDIRDGLQVQCIHCALCVDACDTIMDKMGWPRGLVKYRSEREELGGKTRFFKVKSWGYLITICATTAVLMYSIFTTADMQTSIAQIRQPLFVRLSDGSIQNSYELKFNNLTDQPMPLGLKLKSLEEAELDLGRLENISVRAERQLRVLVKVKRPVVPADDKVTDFIFVITPTNGGDVFEVPARFYQPD